MNQADIDYLRSELEAERISYGELAYIEAAFAEIDPATLSEPAENAMASDMLDELEARLPAECAGHDYHKGKALSCTATPLYRDTANGDLYCSRHRGLARGGAPLIETKEDK